MKGTQIRRPWDELVKHRIKDVKKSANTHALPVKSIFSVLPYKAAI